MFFAHKSLFVTIYQTSTLALALPPRREDSRVSRYCESLAKLETAKPSLLVWQVNVHAGTLDFVKFNADGVRFHCVPRPDDPPFDAYSGRTHCAGRRFPLNSLQEGIDDRDWLHARAASVARCHRDLAISPHARAERKEGSLPCEHLLSERQQRVQQSIKVWMRHACLLFWLGSFHPAIMELR